MPSDSDFVTLTLPLPPETGLDPVVPVPVPGRADRYTDPRPLDEGGAGEVHLVHDRVLQRDVALKLVRPGLPPSVAEGFVREARLCGRLDHPHIGPIHDLGLDPSGRPWFTMKAMRGRTFEAVLREHEGPLDAAFLQSVLGVLIKVCDAVAFANAQGIVHCDLKPANVMVGDFREVYVMDWGVARTLPCPASDEGVISGTPGFMSPEQAWGEASRIDGRADVHGIGAMLFQALTGCPPYVGATSAQRLAATRAGAPARPEDVAPDRRLPPRLCSIAARAVSPDPEDRHPSVAALRDELEAVVRGGWWFDARRFDAGARVLGEGEVADRAYIVTEGRARVVAAGRTVREIGAGEVFGEMALLAGGVRTADVFAVTDLATLEITREALDSELGRGTWLSLFVGSLADRFRETHEALVRERRS